MEDSRWEWRSWFDGPSEPAGRLAETGKALSAGYRTDTYLLTTEAASLPKLREGGLFEVKRCREAREGLELWTMTRSSPFPLPDAEPVLPGAPAYALASAEALAAYAATLPGLAVLPVRKHRRRYALGEAEAEVTAVLVGDRAAESVAVEAARFEAARDAVRRLGLHAHPNADYGAWLRG